MNNALDKIRPIRDWLPDVKKILKDRGATPEISLDFLPSLNRKIFGLRKKALTIIGARTSQGKTSLCTQIAFEVANKGLPVLFLSLEEPPEVLIERIFCQVMKVDNYALLTGEIKQNKEMQKKWIMFSNDIISKIPLLITCGIGKNWQEINKLISMLEPKPKVVIVDYIQAIATKSNISREMTNEYIREFTQGAVEGDYVGILASQIHRGAEQTAGNKPHLWQLKNTGNLEEGSALVLLLHWPNFYDHTKDENDFKIDIAKNRYGQTGECSVIYEPQYYKFSEGVRNSE